MCLYVWPSLLYTINIYPILVEDQNWIYEHWLLMWCITRQSAKFTLAETCVTKLVVPNLTTEVAGGRFRHLNTLPGHFRWTLVESGHAPWSQTKRFPPTLPRENLSPICFCLVRYSNTTNFIPVTSTSHYAKTLLHRGVVYIYIYIYMFKLMRYVYINHSPQYKRQRPLLYTINIFIFWAFLHLLHAVRVNTFAATHKLTVEAPTYICIGIKIWYWWLKYICIFNAHLQICKLIHYIDMCIYSFRISNSTWCHRTPLCHI